MALTMAALNVQSVCSVSSVGPLPGRYSVISLFSRSSSFFVHFGEYVLHHQHNVDSSYLIAWRKLACGSIKSSTPRNTLTRIRKGTPILSRVILASEFQLGR